MISGGWEVFHVEEGGTAKVRVAFSNLCVHGGGVDDDVDGAIGRVLGDGDRARGFFEPAANQSDDLVPSAEIDESMVGVDFVGARRGQCWGRHCGLLVIVAGGTSRSGAVGRGRQTDCKKQSGDHTILEQFLPRHSSIVFMGH